MRPRQDLAAQLAYGFGQLAYTAPAAADRSLQQHGLSAWIEVTPRDDLRLGAGLEGQLAFTGLSGFRGLQASGVGRGWAALDEGRRATTRVDLAWSAKAGLKPEFDYLSGDRFDAALSQELRLRGVVLGGGVRVFVDRLGARSTVVTTPLPIAGCFAGCTERQVEPFGHWGAAPWVAARFAPWERLEVSLTGGVEWRWYRDDAYVAVTGPDGVTTALDRLRRREVRWFTGEAISLRLTPRFSVSARHDLLLVRPATEGATVRPFGSCGPSSEGCAPADVSTGYDKHVFTAGVSLAW